MVKGRRAYARLRLAFVDGESVSRGYKSGRSSFREMPDSCSKVSTRSAGTPPRRHLSIACREIPRDLASAQGPPDFAIARSTELDSLMCSSQPQVDFTVNRRFLAGIGMGLHPWGMKKVTPLGRIILGALKRLDRTQTWLAAEMDVTEQAISKWLRTGKISRENATKLAPILGVSTDHLLRPDSVTDADEEWSKMTPAIKDRLVALYKAMQGELPAEEAPPLKRIK